MVIEFEKRIAHYTSEIESLVGQGSELLIEKLKFALEEVEKLYAFYKSQMVGKGRIVPEQPVSGEENENIIKNVSRTIDGDGPPTASD